MELDGDGLSADEQRLADQLSRLRADPSPEQRKAIMAAVHRAHVPRRSVSSLWRPVFVGLAAAALLVLSTVGAFAASGDARPSSPTYSLRVFGEHVRLTLASPRTREELRIAFASARINQARAILSQGDRSNADGLLRDSRVYLDQAKHELSDLPPDAQGQIQNQLNQAQGDEHQAESDLNQTGRTDAEEGSVG